MILVVLRGVSSILLYSIAVVCISTFLLGISFASEAADDPSGPERLKEIYKFNGRGKISPSIKSIVERFGGRLDWSHQGYIAMDSQWESGSAFHIYIMRPDGSGRRSLTKGHPQVGAYSNGNPSWHPSGNYLVFQCADAPVTPAMAKSAAWQALTNPGAGVANNLWIIKADGSMAWKVTHLRANQGVLHPHFSRAGDKLLWAELVVGKPQKWVMKLADVSFEGSEPKLGYTQTLTPGDMAFYETHGFLPGDTGFLYSATKTENDYRRLEIYRYDFAAKDSTLLTDPSVGAWDEHAQPSPDGSRILWMSSQDISQVEEAKNSLAIKTDYWVMDADGSNKRRITFLNDPSAPEYRKSWNIASDISWSPDGRQAMGYLQQITLFVGKGQFPGTMVRMDIP